jgi:hypothetical protein
VLPLTIQSVSEAYMIGDVQVANLKGAMDVSDRPPLYLRLPPNRDLP